MGKKNILNILLLLFIFMIFLYYYININDLKNQDNIDYKRFDNLNYSIKDSIVNCKKLNLNLKEKEKCFKKYYTCNEKTFCLMEMALYYKNTSFCNIYSNISMNKLCLFNINFTINIEKAIKENNLSICNLYNYSEKDKSRCINEVYFNFAIKKKNVGLCNNISNNYLKNKCLNSLIK